MIPDSNYWFIPDAQFWWHTFATFALEAAGVVAIGWMVTRFLRSAAVCRFVWRTAMICLLLVCVSDFSGVGLLVVDGFVKRDEPVAKPSTLVENHTPQAQKPQDMYMATLSVPKADMPAIYWWPGVIWVLGCAVVLARVLAAHGLLTVLRRIRGRVTDQVVIEEARRLASRFGVRRQVVLIEGRNVMAPFAFGIFRPAIALPADFCGKFRAQEREAILAHELAHVAVGDPIWQLVANLVSALMWWHPAVWLARRWMYDSAEMAADEAVATLENGPQTLAECLVAMARSVARPVWWGGVGMNGTERRSNLRRRVERLLNLPKGGAFGASSRRREVRLMAAVLSVLAAFLVSGFVQEKSGPTNNVDVWKQSPLAVMCWQIKAQLPQGAFDVASMLNEAKGLYESGTLPQALAKLQMVLMLEPGNKAALYYRDLVLEGMRQNRSRYLDWNQPWLYPTYPPKLAQSVRPTHVVITPAPIDAPTGAGVSSDGRTAVHSWQFHLDTKALREALKKEGKDVSKAKMNISLREWLQDKGVDWSDSRKSVFFVEPKGLLLVRGTMSDIKRVEGAVEMMGTVPPQQVTLEGRIAQIGGDADTVLRRLGVDPNAPQILDAQGWLQLMDTLRKEPGVKILTMPKVTTLTERTAQVSIADELADGRKSGSWLTMLPKVSPDTFSIELSVMFARGKTKDKDTPMTATCTAHATVSDHGTYWFICDDPESPGKKDLVLVTVTVIDPAGNRIHTDEQVKAQGRR